MIKTIILAPIVSKPTLKDYNHKDPVVVIDKHTNSTNFILAKEVLLDDHLILINGKIRGIICTISSEKGITEKMANKIINSITRG